MIARIGINGLGRVGRALLRIAQERPQLEVVAINDQARPDVLARLIAHDSLHGRYPGTVEVDIDSKAEANALVIDGRRIALFDRHRPADIPWHEADIDIVVEATGHFRSREQAAGHLQGGENDNRQTGVRRVVVSATAEDVDATFCFGLNHQTFDPLRHHVISNASCTTNCLAPVLAVLERTFGVEHALMNTVHCYTNSQRLMDMTHDDPRRARAAAMNIIPTTSDAVDVIGQILPALEGKIDGWAYRVPVPDGSLVDVTARLARDVDVESLRQAFRIAAQGELANILCVTDEELVSTDFIGSPASATVDLPLVQVVGGRLARVVAWYDNEWGYANRLGDLLTHVHGEADRS